jgi:acetoacetyl-CoA synthetase
MSTPVWEPDAARCAASNLARFLDVLRLRAGRMLSCDDLHRFSVNEPESFWVELWDFVGIKGEKGERPWLIDAERMPGARFFPNARLNYAENALSRRGPDAALVFWGEDKMKACMSWDELREDVGRFQSFLTDARVESDDRVVAMLPNMPESVVGLLGAASNGAVWSSCSPNFGVQGVIDRFSQIAPKVLIACDGYFYAGKEIDLADNGRRSEMRHALGGRVVPQDVAIGKEWQAVVEKKSCARREARDQPVPHHPAKPREVEETVARLHVRMQNLLAHVL